MSSGKIALGVLAGLAAGALAGILLAPAKGSETRKKILTTGEDLFDSVKDKFDDLLDDMTEKFEKVKQDVSDYAEEKMSKPEEAKKAQK